jgi:transcriptional regulator
VSSPKPCLGYPSRTAAIHALRVQGLNTREIADAIGIKEKNVIALECSSGRARQEPRQRVQLGRTMVVPVDVLDALSPHAARRGMTVNHLARLIVTIIVDENMVDAVLDDADALDRSGQ